MHRLVALVVLAACGHASPAAPPPADTEAPATSPNATPQRLSEDTPSTTTAGNTFIAPAGWSLSVRGPTTVLEAPEGGSFLALVDVADADTVDKALETAIAAFDPDFTPKLKLKTPGADGDGWTDYWDFEFEVSPNAKRFQWARAQRAGGVWTITLVDMDLALLEKRSSQLGIVLGQLLPKGYERETFAGRKAHPLDAARLEALSDFVERSMTQTGVPGVAVGIVQDGQVVFSGGFGVREIGKPAKVDANTKFMIASNTKALATLMLAKQVDAGKFSWDTQVTTLFERFKLGSAETTDKVLVKHLICACTGMPRQDLEWEFEGGGQTPEEAMSLLGTMQPTSEFGALFQYSNAMAAAAGFVGGHVAHPKLELGAAYDKAMQELVFTPLGMKSTTHDYAKGKSGNAATAHAPDHEGIQQLATAAINESVAGMRPAGGAWSTVTDMLKYIQMELDEGKLPNGERYISRDALVARRAPQVAINADASYGMGLMIDRRWGIPVVHHGGDLVGFHSDMMWLPEHGVGAIIFTNADPGWIIRTQFQRKLLEVLFDGKPEADEQAAVDAARFFASLERARELNTLPADPEVVEKLAARYANEALGEIAVHKEGKATVFDFGEYQSEVATRTNPDGTVSLWTVAPGKAGLELVVGEADGKRTLIVRDAQHEYVFAEK